MECFENYGSDLVIQFGQVCYRSRDKSLFHMHPSYEVLYIPSGIVAETLVDDQTVRTDFPMIAILAPFCRHFTYYERLPANGSGKPEPHPDTEQGEPWIPVTACPFGCVDCCSASGTASMERFWGAFYVGEEYFHGMSPSLPRLESLTGGANARFFNLSGMEERFSCVVHLIRRLRDPGAPADCIANLPQKLAFGILLELLRELSGEQTYLSVRKRNYILEVIQYISDHLGENLKTEELAKAFFVSRDKLNRDFRVYTGMSVRDFITLSRLNLSKHLLSTSKLTVRQISERCGFENEIYFYSFFKKHTGSTPREYLSERMNS